MKLSEDAFGIDQIEENIGNLLYREGLPCEFVSAFSDYTVSATPDDGGQIVIIIDDKDIAFDS